MVMEMTIESKINEMVTQYHEKLKKSPYLPEEEVKKMVKDYKKDLREIYHWDGNL